MAHNPQTKSPSNGGKNRQNNKRRKPDTQVVANTVTRRGEVRRANRRNSEIVNAKATQHIVDIPVNKSIYNGLDGRQFTNSDLRRTKFSSNKAEKTLKVIPLGGLGEMTIGKNMSLLEYGDDIIVIDMGLLFPGADYPGINYMVPDISYLEERKHKIRGIIFTHAHLDHIGAAKHLLKKLPVPVYGSKFTLAMVERQMQEEATGYQPIYNVLNPDTHERVQLGNSFSIELVRVNHSVPDSTAVLVRTPVGNVINTGDWRYEKRPLDGRKFDIDRLKEVSQKEGILLLMSDSTNCESLHGPGYEDSDIEASFESIMRRPGRVVLSTFSSQIHRVQMALNAAHKTGRKVAFSGYSMIQNVEVALRTGMLKVPKDVIRRMEDIVKLQDDKIVIVCTGSQGEINAVLARMASGSHKYIKVKATDNIVFSSNPIPGNVKNVVRTVDGLMREGSKVLENRTSELDGCGPLHLSGHAYYEDHVMLMQVVKPRFYMPIHGEFHMLVRNAEMAVKDGGMKKEDVFVFDAGDVLEMTADTAKRAGRVKVGSIMYDDSGAEVSEVVLKDRIHMSTEGIFTVILTVEKKTGRLVFSPDIISRGFIYLRDNEKLMAKIRQYLKQKTMKAYGGPKTDMEVFKKEIKEDVGHILFDETQRTPIIIPVVNEVQLKYPDKL